MITEFFNSCISNFSIPAEWKFAIVTPLFKIDDTSLFDNYRGISVLPVLSKIFEDLLSLQITVKPRSKNLR